LTKAKCVSIAIEHFISVQTDLHANSDLEMKIAVHLKQ